MVKSEVGSRVPLPKIEIILFKEVAVGARGLCWGLGKVTQAEHKFCLLCFPHPQPQPGETTGNRKCLTKPSWGE